MSRKQVRSYLRELLEDPKRMEQFEAILDEALGKRKQTIRVHVTERQVELRQDGSVKKVVGERIVAVPVDVEIYSLKDVASITSLFLAFGVGKPPEEKQVTINVNQRLEQMPDAELIELAGVEDGEFRELPAGD